MSICREASFLLEEGALPQQVDECLTDFGIAMGPFRDQRSGRARRGLVHPQTPSSPRGPNICAIPR